MRAWKERCCTGKAGISIIYLHDIVRLFCFVCRYIKGCPRIDGNVDIRMIKYLEDRSGNNKKTLTSKISQKKLENVVQYQLETEVKQLPDLCQLLESVTTARDFLLEIGGNQEELLVEFMVSPCMVVSGFLILCTVQAAALCWRGDQHQERSPAQLQALSCGQSDQLSAPGQGKDHDQERPEPI